LVYDGNSIVRRNVVANIQGSWSINGVGDFNGDGKADILWKESTGSAAIWLMDGSTIDFRCMGNVSDRTAQ
jgi:Tol biopolymer transport system component